MRGMWVAPVLLACVGYFVPARAAAAHARTVAVAQSNDGASPVTKVISMLSDMLAKGKEEKNAEMVEFSKYQQFCSTTRRNKEHSVERFQQEIAQLTADIGMAESEIRDLTVDMAELAKDVSAWDEERTTAINNRAKAKADFESSHKDYTESLGAIEGAKATATETAPKAPVLLELRSRLHTRMPEHARRVIASFLEQQRHLGMDSAQNEAFLSQSAEASQPNAYDSTTGGIIDMIDRLDDKFTDERTALEKKEANARHQHDMLVQELTNQIEAGNQERQSKSALRSEAEQKLGEAKGGLAETQRNLKSDSTFLHDLNAECQTKSEDFESRQELRAGEITALKKAIEILGGDAVKGSSERHLGGASSFLEMPSLLQTGSTSGTRVRVHLQARLHTFLKARAQRLESTVLSMVARASTEDPFTKVRKMIKDLIVKLMEEANEEAEHKGWCDTELGSNKQTRDSKSDEAEALKANIEELTAAIAKLTTEIAELEKQVGEIDASITTATNQRHEEKAKNTAAISDARAGQAAVAQAVTVLKGFYAQAADATSLAQVQTQDQADIFNAPFTGQQDASSGVIGMLEVIESDFSRLESESSASEADAVRVFDRFVSDSKTDKAVKTTSSRHKMNSRQQKQTALAHSKKDLRGVSEELEAAAAYYEKLKPSCVNPGQSYEERVARRKEEIESLQDGLKILSGQDV